MKEHPILFSTPMVKAILDGRKSMTRRVVKFNKKIPSDMVEDQAQFYCPYGQAGDHLWVRETHAQDSAGILYYKADGLLHPPNEIINDKGKEVPTHWRSSIHMFRWASRITLEITNVRVERLQEITDMDAIREGIVDDGIGSPAAKFYTLWKIINGKKYPWSSNPWVWVIEFNKL